MFSARRAAEETDLAAFSGGDDAGTQSEDDFNDPNEPESRGTVESLTDSFSSSSSPASASMPSSPLTSPSRTPSPLGSGGIRCLRPLRTRSNSGNENNTEIDWRKCYAERVKTSRDWAGKPSSVATLRGHALAVMSVIIHGSEAASFSLDCTIRTWNLANRRCTGVFSGHTDWVNAIDCDSSNPNLNQVVSGSYDATIRLWDTKNKKCKRIFRGHQNIVWSVQLAGNRLVSCSSDGTLRLWDVEAGLCTRIMTGHESAIYCCQYDPVRNAVVTGSMDKTLRFWDLNAAGDSNSGCVGVMRGHTDRLCCIQEDPVENLLVSGSRDSTIRLWDTRVLGGTDSSNGAADNRACFRVLRGHDGRVCCLRFDEDKIVSGSDDNTVKVWSLHGKGLSTGRKTSHPYCINTFTAHDYWVNSLQFQDNMLVSAAADDTIKIWDFSPVTPKTKKTHSLWYASVVSSRPQSTYITNPITANCVLS